MNAVGWFEIVVGASIAALWTMLLVTGQVPEIGQGRTDIWFHLVAELVTAVLLVAAGMALLTSGGPSAATLAALAAGALAYTTVNSAGHYAQLGQWPVVGMFVALTLATAVVAVVLLRGDVA